MKRAGTLRRLASRVHIEAPGTIVAGRWSLVVTFAPRVWGLGGYGMVGTDQDDVDRGLTLVVGPVWASVERLVQGDDDLSSPAWWAS